MSGIFQNATTVQCCITSLPHQILVETSENPSNVLFQHTAIFQTCKRAREWWECMYLANHASEFVDNASEWSIRRKIIEEMVHTISFKHEQSPITTITVSNIGNRIPDTFFLHPGLLSWCSYFEKQPCGQARTSVKFLSM